MNKNGLDFLNTVLQGILFSTSSIIKNWNINTFESGIKQVNTLYLQMVLKIISLHADSEFEPLWPKVVMLGIELNTTPNKEHVPEFEWFNYVVTEQVHSDRSETPFQLVSKLMIIHIVTV